MSKAKKEIITSLIVEIAGAAIFIIIAMNLPKYLLKIYYLIIFNSKAAQ